MKIAEPTPIKAIQAAGDSRQQQNLEQSFNGDLFKEYQKQKQRLQETIEQKERERDELVRQMSLRQALNNRVQNDR
jgi:uncharacterized protein YukE